MVHSENVKIYVFIAADDVIMMSYL